MNEAAKIQLMKDRYLSLTSTEKIILSKFSSFEDVRFSYLMQQDCHDEFDRQTCSYGMWFWKGSIVGENFRKYTREATKHLENPEKFTVALKKAQNRKRWGSIKNYHTILKLFESGKVTKFIVSCFLNAMAKDDQSLWYGFMNDPLFKLGEMVKLRTNAGVDSVLTQHTYSRGTSYYGCGSTSLKAAKKKTFMIVGVEPDISGSIYAKAYAYHEKQGGCRFYKVLPLGETKTYYVVEKFLKRFRVKK